MIGWEAAGRLEINSIYDQPADRLRQPNRWGCTAVTKRGFEKATRPLDIVKKGPILDTHKDISKQSFRYTDVGHNFRTMKNKLKNIELSDLLALIALLISVISIYFSVFYKDHELTVSVIDSNVEYQGDSVNVDLLYHNVGNTYSTIIHDYLVFYQNEDWHNKGVIFSKGKHVFVNNMTYNSVVLTPGQQILRRLEITTNFNKIDTSYRRLSLNEIINVGLVSTYINANGLRSSDMFKIGYVKLDNNKKFKTYKLEYNVFELDSDNYFSSTGIE